MSDDVEWGPWVRYDGKGCPLVNRSVVDVMLLSELNGDHEVCGTWSDMLDWRYFEDIDPIVAYRVKKEPVVDVRHQIIACGGWSIINAECTYTDGKPTKIHWEAEQ